MKRAEQLERIFSQFDRSAKDFCADIGGLYCEITPFYKGEETTENLKYRIARIYTNTCIIVFRYTANGPVGTADSILDGMVCFGKTETELPVPLPFVTDFCNEDIVSPLCIPYISNADGMKQAFSLLGETVKVLLPKITVLSCDEEQKQAMEAYFFEEYRMATGDTTDYAVLGDWFSQWLALHFSSEAYLLALKGKPEKAIKKLAKYKKKFRYEERLLTLWQAGKTTDCSKIPAIVSNMEWIDDRGMTKSDSKELLPILLSIPVLAIPATAAYLGLYFLLILLQKNGSVYLTGVFAQAPYCVITGFVTAVCVSFFTRLFAARLLYRKDFEKLEEQDNIENGGDNKVMKVFTAVIVTGCVAFTFLVAAWNLNFKTDGFIDNTKFFSLKGPFYSYDEIECVRYVPTRVNGYGETLENPSYALVLKNGREIDLYDYDAIENYETPLLDFLQKKGVKIVKEEQTP